MEGQLDYARIGRRIRQARKLKGWRQERLAKECDISLSFMGHIERGTRRMSLDTFAKICSILEADTHELLWGAPYGAEPGLADIWEGFELRDADSYRVYVKIMKSIADIMCEDVGSRMRIT